MSDQHETLSGVILDLEELFQSRDFGREPARFASTGPATAASEPVRLEQVFLADVFGRPEIVEESASAVAERPVLVLLQGGGRGGLGRNTGHYRAISVVSGVAAAALALAGLAPGTRQAPGRSPGTEQAQGALPGQDVPLGGGGPQPAPARATAPQIPADTGTSAASGVGANSATLTAFSPPASPPPPGGGPSSGTPPLGGGGGGMLTPALTAVGNEVSGVGSSASSTSGDLDQNLPVGAALQGVGTAATSSVNTLGGGTPPTVLAGSVQQ